MQLLALVVVKMKLLIAYIKQNKQEQLKLVSFILTLLQQQLVQLQVDF